MNKSYQRYLQGDLIGPTKSMGMLLSQNTTYDQVCPDCDHDGCSTERGRADKIIKNVNHHDPLISYKINNYGYRSDDITLEDAKLNFLYNGCSYAFGVGLPLESVWAYQLNSILGGEKFINLGINSGSYKTIVYDVFNYIRKFGKPKGVFLLFPNIERQIMFSDENDGKSNIYVRVYRNPPSEFEKFSDIITKETNMFEFYNTVKMLEDYLLSLDIPLIWTTWDHDLNKNILMTKGFNNYINLDNFDVYDRLSSSKKPEILDNVYWDIARDLSHQGADRHLYYASIMHEAWKEKYEKTS